MAVTRLCSCPRPRERALPVVPVDCQIPGTKRLSSAASESSAGTQVQAEPGTLRQTQPPQGKRRTLLSSPRSHQPGKPSKPGAPGHPRVEPRPLHTLTPKSQPQTEGDIHPTPPSPPLSPPNTHSPSKEKAQRKRTPEK
ncbi:hypothetical protein H8959_010613 [Pygathrix nigripes]